MSSIHQQLLEQEAIILRQSFDAFLYRSFLALNGGTTFLPNWHLQLLAQYLQAIEQGLICRLIINMPPRYLKSITASVAWPAWLLGQNPQRRVIVASYAEKLSLKHSLDCRHVMLSDWYQRAYPETQIAAGQNEKHKFVTTERGFRLATSVGGTLTGEGGDILILDDPLNPLHAESEVTREKANRWFDHTFSSRLNDKQRGAMVIVMQRLHEDDLCGYLQRKGGWQVLNLPAIAPIRSYDSGFFRSEGTALHPARESILQLKQVQHEMGSHVFSAQYQQQPRPKSGAMVRPHWLVYEDEDSEEPGQIVQSWDTAIKAGAQNDPSVCLTARVTANECHLLDCFRARLEYHDLRSNALRLAEKWQPQAIVVEDKASGQSLLQDLRTETNLPLIPILPRQDKLTRFAAITPLIEAGKLVLPPNAHWLNEFEQELFTFPASKHDDQVDALSQLLRWWLGRRKQEMGVRRV
jgi:predicted phage terminase large subunit-like protein